MAGDVPRPQSRLRPVPAPEAARAGIDVPIESKFHAPGARQEWVERRRLVRNLAGTDARLVLVEAPAGFGKTTLIAQWQASAEYGHPFAWLSLDPDDNHPSRLWWHITHALQRTYPGLGVGPVLQALRAPVPDIMGTIVLPLVNVLMAASEPVVLVLDDYHLISEPACHDQIAFLLHHLLPPARLVLITRADPPLPLARLRAAGEMAEIRVRELRFAAAEAGALVHAVAGVRLSGPGLARLVERTEGWPAGVYLAALSLRGHPSPSEFIRQFSGDNRFIGDFLAEEVLSRQPGEIQQFLMRTSILGRFCAPLCDAVTGVGDAAEIMDTLERENVFLVPLDDNRHWYRYHQLFAQLLRSQLIRTEPGIIAALHERASAWHERSGSMEVAVNHALAAGNITRAIDLIARCWPGYAEAGQARTILGWIRSLGDEQIAADPVAAHCAAWAAALCGEREEVRRWLLVIEAGQHEGPLPDGMRSLESSAALLRGVFGFEGLRVMRESAEVAAELENDPASGWCALAQAALGFSRYLSGEFTSAAELLEAAVQNQSLTPVPHLVVLSLLALVAVELGRLPKAQELADQARGFTASDDAGSSPQGSFTRMASGAVFAAEGRLEEARREFERALQGRQRVPGASPWPTLVAMLMLAQVLLDLGERTRAADILGTARDVLTVLPGGAEAQLARVVALEHRLSGLPRPAAAAGPLTDRELAVLRLLQGTLSLREIAAELHLSANTVKTHVRAVYRKLGVSTRHDAVALGRETGILYRGQQRPAASGDATPGG